MNGEKKQITILGSSGSIGVQALQVIDSKRSEYSVNFLTVNNNIDLLAEQIELFRPRGVVITNEEAYKEFKRKYSYSGITLCGNDGLNEAAADPFSDTVVSALVGFSGVIPTLSALNAGKTVALANKETLVSAGSIITKAAKENNTNLIAVDSEHSAILQCIAGERFSDIEKIILTASGGPFLNTPMEEFEKLSINQALAHPNWSMGSKITIDSATMMNKGFEIIEAYWLFDIPVDYIDVIIHPQSIIHSLVQFIDGSVKAQLGLPDMRIPISYALSYPSRMEYDFQRLNLLDIKSFTFFEPDFRRYPCLRLAYEAIHADGNAPSILNAANEIAVNAFLGGDIKFTDIHRCIEATLEKIDVKHNCDIDDIIETDKIAREYAGKYVDKLY